MNNAHTHSKPLRAESPTCRMSDTPGVKPEALRRLFKKMESGVQPDFLEIMGAISEMVAFYTDHDTPTGEEQIEEFLMSQNKCRFCS